MAAREKEDEYVEDEDWNNHGGFGSPNLKGIKLGTVTKVWLLEVAISPGFLIKLKVSQELLIQRNLKQISDLCSAQP